MVERFTRHFESRYERVCVTDPLVETASALVDRHALRAYDALQPGGCLDWKRTGVTDPVFVCSDKSLLAAAIAEGLATLDPTGNKKVR